MPMAEQRLPRLDPSPKTLSLGASFSKSLHECHTVSPYITESKAYCKRWLLAYGSGKGKAAERLLSVWKLPSEARITHLRSQGTCQSVTSAGRLVTEASGTPAATSESATEVAKKGFHQSRFTATKRLQHLQQEELAVQLREPINDAELHAIAMLRAMSFYAYRPERAFAGKLHQQMKAREEYERLLELKRNGSRPEQQEACLAAFCRWDTVASAPEELRVTSADGEAFALVGSLDVCAARAVEGQVLIGANTNAAYLSNVCVSEAARRRSVGRSLLNEARRRAREWGVDALYVHTMAVNEVAQHFYYKHGFVLEREESSNEAHYRGHCLDGIEGRGRTVLLRDERLNELEDRLQSSKEN